MQPEILAPAPRPLAAALGDAGCSLDVASAERPAAGIEGFGLEAGVLHLWTAFGRSAVSDPREYDTLLSADERQTARGFSPARREQFVAGRVLTRLALSRCCSIAPQEWSFSADVFGRPRIVAPASYRDVHFSISHTGGLVACLISRIEQAAVDVEKIVMWDDLSGVAARILSARELCDLALVAGAAWYTRFFDYWTLKEAYAKACGPGLGLEFTGIELDLGVDRCAATRLPLDESSDLWSFQRFRSRYNYALAVAFKRPLPGDCTLVHHSVRIVGSGAAIVLEEG